MGMDSDASPLPIWPASSQPTGSSSTSMDENYRRIPNWLAPQGDSENQQVSTGLHACEAMLI
jgi:hypothetical protein